MIEPSIKNWLHIQEILNQDKSVKTKHAAAIDSFANSKGKTVKQLLEDISEDDPLFQEFHNYYHSGKF